MAVPYFMRCLEMNDKYQACRGCLGRAHLSLGMELRERYT